MMRTALMLLFALAGLGGRALAQDRSRSPHGDLKLECAACHRPEGWTPVRISKRFDHGKSGFALAGAHLTATCRACHKTLDFAGTKSACAGCHQDIHRGELGVDCARCHSARSFLDRTAMAQAHQTTRFPLQGAHLSADCQSCHHPTAQGQLTFALATTECVDCHNTDFQGTRNPDHVAGGFPRDCAQCHTSTLWDRARFNHDGSGFPLTGAHRAAACAQCHIGNRFSGTPTVCVACHQQDYNGATNPNHAQAQFSTDCVACHGTVSWTGASFDHSRSNFPLTGAHRATACDQCHVGGRFAGTPTDCVACHQQDYNTAQTPNHVQSQFPTDCTGCHTTTAWLGATFDHSKTLFPLTGSHRTVLCADCHADGVYKGKSTVCSSCHMTDYTATTNPNHIAAQFPTDCASCHNTTTWIGAQFNHDGQFFPIYSGKHRGQWTSCSDCHQVSTDFRQYTCLTCHEHNQAQTNSSHQGISGYTYTSSACLRCHPTGVAN